MKKWLTIGLSLLLFGCSTNQLNPVQGQKKEQRLAVNQVMRLNLSGDPITLDPRRVRDMMAVNLCEFLYEGLMRLDPEGNPTLAAAESMEISPDGKTYTFSIRDSTWTSGLSVTAYDFEKTWKTSLLPSFPCDNAYLLYVIKNAKALKEGKVSADELGVKALDDKTLQVTLNHPTPYFTQLLTHPISFALPRTSSPWEIIDSDVIVNGPFKLMTWKHDSDFVLTKNPNYWDANRVKLERVECSIVKDSSTELRLFEDGQLDWAGSPLGSFSEEAIQTWKARKELHSQPVAGTSWLRLNVQKPPFDNGNLRRAFALAINRQELVDYVLKNDQLAAVGIVPPSLWDSKKPAGYFRDGDYATARRLLRDGLKEMGITQDQLPSITLTTSNHENNRRIAQVLQQQWKKALNIDVDIQVFETKVMFQTIRKTDYQIATGSWFADFYDASNFLDVFKYVKASTNNTNWENNQYTALLDEAENSPDLTHRMQLLQKAEKLLIQEMPVIPLYHYTFSYVQKDNVNEVVLSPYGLYGYQMGLYDGMIDS